MERNAGKGLKYYQQQQQQHRGQDLIENKTINFLALNFVSPPPSMWFWSIIFLTLDPHLIHIPRQLAKAVLILRALSVSKPLECILALVYNIEMLGVEGLQGIFEVEDGAGVRARHGAG